MRELVGGLTGEASTRPPAGRNPGAALRRRPIADAPSTAPGAGLPACLATAPFWTQSSTPPGP
eukprot:1509176-Alexandrium_andersonii.AAC.1